MDIGTIIAGLQAIASIADAMNKVPAMTPAQAEEKPKKTQQPMSTIVVLPNQTPPIGVGVPPPPPPMALPPYWNQLPPANVLRNPVWRVPYNVMDMPVFRGLPLTTYSSDFRSEPSLEELYQLYFGTRW
jgi:hypothetical protein